VLFKLGKPREALEPMERALGKIEEPDPTLYDHLGDIHAALGELDMAREAWRKSLEIEPNEAIRKKLDAASPK
jgi:Flp pilus assembly protein TadD